MESRCRGAEFERREKIGTVGNSETRQGRAGQGDVLSHGMLAISARASYWLFRRCNSILSYLFTLWPSEPENLEPRTCYCPSIHHHAYIRLIQSHLIHATNFGYLHARDDGSIPPSQVTICVLTQSCEPPSRPTQ